LVPDFKALTNLNEYDYVLEQPKYYDELFQARALECGGTKEEK
jgi:hypothetical protein